MLEQDTLRREWLTTTVVDLAIKLGLIAMLLYWAFVIIRPLLAVFVWSIILAVALYPVYDQLARLLWGRRSLAAGIIATLCIATVLGPVAWAAVSLIASLEALIEHLGRDFAFAPPEPALRNWPLIGTQLYDLWQLASENFTAAFTKLAPQLKPVGSRALSILGNASTAILTIVVSIGFAGFLFVPGPSLVNKMKLFSRNAVTARGEEFIELAGATIRSVSRGIIGLSVLQAGLAGVGLWMAGIPAASLLTAAVLIFGIAQIGSAFVLIPVIVWEWIRVDTSTALLFTAYMIPVGLLDNILKPIIMGRGTSTPTAVIFLGLIGGVLAHGMIGVFVGPIVLAVAWSLLVAWFGESRVETSEIAAQPIKDLRLSG